MNSNNINAIFVDYVDTKNTQYAILINGTWGSGKTYFWKNSLEKIAHQKEYKTIYLSLNGINKIESLEHLLFIKLIPYLSNQENGKLKTVLTLATNAIDQASKHYLKSSLGDLFKGVSVDTFNFKKYIVCFDDLERCQIPIREVLGFINNYVEHKNLKTIILADEANLDLQQKEKVYDSIKEKVIGRVLNFELEINEVVPNLFKKYSTNDPDFYNFLLSNQSEIIDILTEFKQSNLRIISFFLDVLSKIFPAIQNTEKIYVDEIIMFSAIVCIEFKRGKLLSSNYKNPDSLKSIKEDYFLQRSRQIRDSSKSDETKDKSYTEIFCETYLSNERRNYFCYGSIYSYVLSGLLDLATLTNEIKGRDPELLSPEINSFRVLITYKFRELSDEKFNSISKEVLDFSKKGLYSVYDYVYLAHFFYFFSNNKLIETSVEELNDIFLEGLSIAKSNIELNTHLLDNLSHFYSAKEEISIIYGRVKAIHNEIKAEQYKKESMGLIEAISSEDYMRLSAIFQDHQFSEELFPTLDIEKAFESIVNSSNKMLHSFTQLLSHRYRVSNIGEFLYADKSTLESLKTKIETQEATNPIEQPLRSYLLATMVSIVDGICLHLENTKKK